MTSYQMKVEDTGCYVKELNDLGISHFQWNVHSPQVKDLVISANV